VILEAMASGVPVISNRITNIPDVVTDGVTGFLATPGDTESLTAKLEEALSLDQDDRTMLIRRARTLVEDYAGCERTAATLEGVWEG
jgi:glycosyltransferase involved in cell wall biosynthesis